MIGEVGKPPEFVLEVASRSTGTRDYMEKRQGYAGYGVGEYWRFDGTGGRYHDAALSGDVLVEGEYRPVPIIHEDDGLIWGLQRRSESGPVLGLRRASITGSGQW